MFLVTGGAGFIGSRLAKKLLARDVVVVVDNFVSGDKNNLADCGERGKKLFIERTDIRNLGGLNKVFKKFRPGAVFHFAADPNVKTSAERPLESFENNAVGTFNVLEACRKNDVGKIVFASSSVVYGDAELMPTPETAEIRPISNYGASKVAGEAYCFSYAASYGIRATVLRYANIIGPPSKHGVIIDFFHKLKRNPKRLQILGDGRQTKSYLFIDDCVDATLTAFRKQKTPVGVFNVGSRKAFPVRKIADMVSGAMGLKPFYEFSGGQRGWIGDVREMLLDTTRLEALGWREKTSLDEAVRIYVKWLDANG